MYGYFISEAREWLHCVDRGDNEDMEIECSQGQHIRIISLYLHQRSYDSSYEHPFCGDPSYNADWHCMTEDVQQTETLRALCDTQQQCHTTVVYPDHNIGCDGWYDGTTYIRVTYICLPCEY